MPELLDSYAPQPGRYDELLGDGGTPRAPWQRLIGALQALGESGLRQRRAELERLLIEHGMAHPAAGKDGNRRRPWSLDLLPLPISSREWREVEVGLAQRAELLRQVLHDLYGSQRLIERGLLPAELVFGHAGFRLPCHGAGVPLEQTLILYAADLSRAPDGRLQVTGDRTQAPSGIGYALEARSITSRVLPSLFRDANVHSILPFMRTLRRCLVNLADGDPAAVALLSAGPANPSYSEHAYLAHQLGIPLIEGADIEVAGGSAWLERADGRQPLRAILRRMDDDYCDPLELNRRSLIGSPGLLQAVRNRQLCLANPLGSSVVENPALMAFLPALCRELLGETLRLPSVPTWWCGQADSLDHVLAHLDEMVLRSVHQGAETAPVAVHELDGERRRRLLERLRQRPQAFVAQPLHAHSTAPVLHGTGLVARATEFRSFAVAVGDGFTVMAGGIARASRQAEAWRAPGPLGGVGKDVWVLASEPQQEAYSLPLFGAAPAHAAASLPTLAVDHLIWFGRYAARSELTARLLHETVSAVLDGASPLHDPVLSTLLPAVTWQTTIYPGFVGPLGAPNRAEPSVELLRATADPDRAESLLGAVRALRDNAETLRDLLSESLWRNVNRLLHDLRPPQDLASAQAQLELCALRVTAIVGALPRTLHAGSSRDFIEFGLLVETALGSARLLRSLLAAGAAPATLIAPVLLDLLDCAAPPPADDEDAGRTLLQHLLFDAGNPRSLQHQLQLLETLIARLPRVGAYPAASRLSALRSRLAALDVETLAAQRGEGGELDRQLMHLDLELRELALGVEHSADAHRRRTATQLVEVA